jgi:hypothetical protein
MKTKIEVDGDVNLDIRHYKHNDKKYIPFIMIGKAGYTNILGGKAMNAAKLMMSFSKPESWLMTRILEDGEARNLQAVIRGKDLSSGERQKLTIAYKSLRAKDIIRRVKREYYMVNPMFWIPVRDREVLYDYYNTL